MTDQGTSLHGRVALITGASRGVGRGIALAMADKGAAIAVAGRNLQSCRNTVAELNRRGAEAIAIQCDVASGEDITRAVEATTSRFGRLDVLVHSAQSFNYGPIRRLTPQEFDESWRTGPLAAVQLMQAAFPALRETQGLIVNVASGAGITAPPAMAAYAMAKEAMRTLTRVAAVEWGRLGSVRSRCARSRRPTAWTTSNSRWACPATRTWCPRFRWGAWATPRPTSAAWWRFSPPTTPGI